MKIRSIALLVTSALSLMGCKSDSTLENQSPIDPNIAASLNAETKINFDILSTDQKLILPTYLAMDAQDGTLATEVKAQDKTSTSDPLVAMGQTDGWSTTQPITINFIGKALDPTPAATSFYLIKGTPTDPDDTTKPTLLSQQNKDFTLQVSSHSLIVILLKPLDPASNYMYAVTDDLKDVNGQAVGMSNSYALLKSDNLPPAPALLPAQKITHVTEEAFHGIVQKRDIIFSSWFTTLSSGDVLFAAKMATLQTISNQIETHEPVIIDKDSDKIAANLYKLTPPTPGGAYGNKTRKKNQIYSGYVYLPYYLSTDAENYLTTPWHSDMPSLAKIKYVLSNGSDADKNAILDQLAEKKINITVDDLAKVATDKATQIKVLTALKGKKLYLSNGDQLDPERLITRYSPVPKMQSVAKIQYNLIIPPLSKKCEQSGYSVTIFQHGVTSNKEQFVYSNPSLPDKIIGDQCRAIFAIDLPLHGDRGIGGKNASADPKMFLNFIDLTVARDNLRQSVIDVVNLRAIIGKVLTDSDPSELNDQLHYLKLNNGVSFAGHSLGAITGVDVANIANESTQNAAADKNYFNINTVALANPGAEIPYLLLNSPSFGDLIKSGIIESIDPTFKKRCEDKNQDLSTCYQTYESKLTAEAKANNSLAQITLNTMNDSFNKFAYAAQTVMDPVDPINLARNIPNNVAILMEEMQDDMVIPNSSQPSPYIYSPFTGTTPLIAPLSLSAQLAGNQSVINNDIIKHALRFKGGYHTSILSPINPFTGITTPESKNVTNAMQTALASFVKSDGKQVIISDQHVMSQFTH